MLQNSPHALVSRPYLSLVWPSLSLSLFRSAPPGIVEFYVRDCCNHAAETREIVRGVHRQKEAVVKQCRTLSGLQLTRIDKNFVYNDREFAKQQAEHCVGIRAKVRHTGTRTLPPPQRSKSGKKAGGKSGRIDSSHVSYNTITRVIRTLPPSENLKDDILSTTRSIAQTPSDMYVAARSRQHLPKAAIFVFVCASLNAFRHVLENLGREVCPRGRDILSLV